MGFSGEGAVNVMTTDVPPSCKMMAWWDLRETVCETGTSAGRPLCMAAPAHPARGLREELTGEPGKRARYSGPGVIRAWDLEEAMGVCDSQPHTLVPQRNAN